MTLEDELRNSLRARADRFEPTEGSYVQLQRRLADSSAGNEFRSGGDGRPGVGPRLLAVAAALAVMVGAGAFVLGADNDDVISTDSATSPTAPVAEGSEGLPADTDAAAASGVAPDDGRLETGESPNDADADVDPSGELGAVDEAPAGILGPPRSTWEFAALDFLELIQVPSERAVLDPDGDQVMVSAVSESGELRPVTVLTIGARSLANGDDGFVVVRAESPRVVIEQPSSLATVTENRLVVSGEGEGFEATVNVEVYSANDGVALVKTFTQAGNFGVMAPYERAVNVYGDENAWVVVTSSTGSDAGIPEFAATPITVRAPRPAVTYTVTNIDVDDPDGGLVARNMPGGEQLTVLPMATSGIQVRGVPSTIGEQRWVNVWLPPELAAAAERRTAWVSAAYLALDEPLAGEVLESIGTDFVAAVETGGVGFDQLPWTERRSVAVGWGGADLQRFSAEELDSTDTWIGERTWAIPEERFGVATSVETLRSFVDLGDIGGDSEFAVSITVETGFEPSAVSPYGVVQARVAPQFAGAQWVKVFDASSDASDWKTVTLFVENTADGPEIVGVVVDFWIP